MPAARIALIGFFVIFGCVAVGLAVGAGSILHEGVTILRSPLAQGKVVDWEVTPYGRQKKVCRVVEFTVSAKMYRVVELDCSRGSGEPMTYTWQRNSDVDVRYSAHDPAQATIDGTYGYFLRAGAALLFSVIGFAVLAILIGRSRRTRSA